MLSPHSAEELLKFVASPITLSICSRKERKKSLRQALPVRKFILWLRMEDGCLWKISLPAF